MTTREIPREALRFRAQSKLRISFEKDEEGEPIKDQAHARFRILGATGKRIAQHGWFSNVYVDLASLEIPERAPVLLDHNPGQRVGMADKIELSDEGLSFEGAFLKRGKFAKEVLEDAEDGFAWGASISFMPEEIVEVQEGAETEVNGEMVAGPATIMRGGFLDEVSFTAQPADRHTAAAAMNKSADRVSVRFSVLEPVEGGEMTDTKTERMTLEGLQKEHPEVFRQAFEAGVAHERDRAGKILAKTKPHTIAMAAEKVASGASYAEALEAFLEAKDPADGKADRLAQFGKSDGIVGPADEPQTVAFANDEQRWRAEFSASPQLQAEFGDVEFFVTFKSKVEQQHKGVI
jgi:hypothetical protein